jgi:hypothetical protein
MRKLFIPLVLLICFSGSAQTNLTGAYGYSLPVEGDAPKDEKNNGPEGSLVLVRLDGNKYRFWLDVSKGWPSYNQGVTDGTITFKNDTASFDNSYEDADYPCILKFKAKGNTININSMSTSFNCGFGNGVVADGDYARLKKQPIINNHWLKEQYFQAGSMQVTAKKAMIYQDENGTKAFAKPQYFIKGDKLLNIDEREKTVYTEYVTPSGKFVYGWLRKSDLKILGN